jgi:hypothetical protein
MWWNFLWQNFHFTVNLFSALAFFSVFWLYLDAWLERKTLKDGLKILGFLFLSLGFLVHATLVESVSVIPLIFENDLNEKISLILINMGYLALLVGLISDPLQPKPNVSNVFGVSLGVMSKTMLACLLAPISCVLVAWFYLRRATLGLENHLKRVSLAFFFFSVYELINLGSLFSNSANVDIYNLVNPFGYLWIAGLIVESIGAVILIVWAFSYLLKRINSQLFIIFISMIISIFLITTVSFSFLLLKNIQNETLARLKTDVSVLSYSLESKKSEAMALVSVLAQDQGLTKAILDNDKKALWTSASGLLLNHKLSSVVIIDKNGLILARGEDHDRVGDSVSGDPSVRKVLQGLEVSTAMSRESAVSPVVLVRSAVPVRNSGLIVGAIVTETLLDNAYLDGIKKATGLEVAVFGDGVLAATTISDLNGVRRPIGIRETNAEVKKRVFTSGNDYSGLVSILNTDYYAVYRPLKDMDNSIVGMLLVCRPASSVLTAAGQSTQLTFLVAVTLILLSIVPSYLVSKYITYQLK